MGRKGPDRIFCFRHSVKKGLTSISPLESKNENNPIPMFYFECTTPKSWETWSGLGNLGNTRSKLSLKCATTLEIGRLANRGSYPTTASRFWVIEIRLLVYQFGPFPLIRSFCFFLDAFGPRGEKLNGKQTKFSGKNSPKLNPHLTETHIFFSYHFHINFIIDLWPRFWWLNIYL